MLPKAFFKGLPLRNVRAFLAYSPIKAVRKRSIVFRLLLTFAWSIPLAMLVADQLPIAIVIGIIFLMLAAYGIVLLARKPYSIVDHYQFTGLADLHVSLLFVITAYKLLAYALPVSALILIPMILLCIMIAGLVILLIRRNIKKDVYGRAKKAGKVSFAVAVMGGAAGMLFVSLTRHLIDDQTTLILVACAAYFLALCYTFSVVYLSKATLKKMYKEQDFSQNDSPDVSCNTENL